MTTSVVLIVCGLFFFAKSLETEPSLESVWNHTSRHIHHVKVHTEHMVTLNLTSEIQQKITDIAKSACDKFSNELETHGNEFQSKAGGQHNEELTAAANNAATQFKTCSQTLKGLDGYDIKQRNTEYFKVADLVLEAIKKLIDAGPCEEIEPIIRSVLEELKSDSDNYQNQFHTSVGEHAPPSDGAGGHHHHHHQHGHGEEGHHHQHGNGEGGHHHHHHN